MFKEMIAEEDLAKSEEREREETVSDEEMAKRYYIAIQVTCPLPIIDLNFTSRQGVLLKITPSILSAVSGQLLKFPAVH